MDFQRIPAKSPLTEVTKTKLQSSGIMGFDQTIGGGIPDGSLILLLGEPGSGYETFALQVLYNQAKQGKKVFYVSVDKPPSEVDLEMMTFGWSVDTYKSLGSWTYVDAYGAKYATEDSTSPVISWDKGLLNLLRTKFINIVAKSNQPFTIIDTVSHLLLDYDENQVRELVENFTTNVVRKVGGVHILLMVKGMHDTKTEVLFSHIADGVIDFYLRERSDQLQRTFRVRKMRKAIYDTRLYPVNLEEDGLQIETARRMG